MSFEKLLSDLDELQKLQKSAPADDQLDAEGEGAADVSDDADIAAAAAEGADAGDHAEPDADDFGGEPDGDADDELMGKSFRFTLEDGQEVEAVDGTELVKSLMARFDAFGSTVAQKEEAMTKALGAAVDLIKSQGEAIASLQTEVKRLASEGRGRKAVVSVAEKPAAGTMMKSEPAGISGEEFMAKALSAQKVGRITALEVSKAEGYLLKGLAVPADIVNRVLA
jgi:hypothetical protein